MGQQKERELKISICGKMYFRQSYIASQCGQRSPPQAYVICRVTARAFVYLVTYVASLAGILS